MFQISLRSPIFLILDYLREQSKRMANTLDCSSSDPRRLFLLFPWTRTLLPFATSTSEMNLAKTCVSKGQKKEEGHWGTTNTPFDLHLKRCSRHRPTKGTGGTSKQNSLVQSKEKASTPAHPGTRKNEKNY